MNFMKMENASWKVQKYIDTCCIFILYFFVLWRFFQREEQEKWKKTIVIIQSY